MNTQDFDNRVIDILNDRKALLPSLKRNASGTVNGNSYTWWRHKTEQALEAIGVHSQDARDLTRNLVETYYYNH